MTAALTREAIEDAFREMGEILVRQRKVGEIAVYGGAAILLQFDATFATRDVDAVIEGAHGAVQSAAQEVARRRDWPTGWLSEAVSAYLPRNRDLRSHASYPSESRVGLRVYVAPPEYILAMKLAALRVRSRDLEDAAMLARETGRTTAEALRDLHARFFPDQPLDPRRAATVEEVARRATGAT
jgi:hypothetical protein